MPANFVLSRLNVWHLGLTTLLFAFMCSPATALAQQQVHVETTVTDITDSNFGYGPASATCDAASGGPGCKFVSFDFRGTCKTVQEVDTFEVSECTVSGTPTILFLFSPSGAHDQTGLSTGVCAPFTASLTTTYEDGSTLNANDQGEVCCADDATDGLCKGGFGPPFVTHESWIITGGTGRFKGVKGGAVETGAGYAGGSEIAQQEQVWIFPKSSKP